MQSREYRTEVIVRAPAKINLVLRVLDRREDGYHNIWSLLQTIGLEDELHVCLRPDSSAITLQSNHPRLATDATNLVHRAVALVREAAQQSFGVDVRLRKEIPLGGGLGGGSSDAAATILALNHLLGLGWSEEKMAVLSRTLGSDVPFFFHAPTAVISGRGEIVESVHLAGRRWIVLVNPGFSIETRWAYQELSRMRFSVPVLSHRLAALTGQESLTWDAIVPLMENDFEGALRKTYPAMEQVKYGLLKLGAEAALLSGSGATMFGMFRDEPTAVRCMEALRGHPEWKLQVVSTLAETAAPIPGG
jgi:4-diphosphocytidyl-2-C-methyl-D-erythritol kinase